MKKILTIGWLLLGSSPLWAQQQVDVRFINMTELLPYILPFYAITMLAMGLFIHKLMRPAFSNKWLYLCTIVGILGAGLITYKFQNFRETKLTDTKTALTKIEKKQKARIEQENRNEVIGNFWRIAIPNFIFLLLGIVVDWQQKKKKKRVEAHQLD